MRLMAAWRRVPFRLAAWLLVIVACGVIFHGPVLRLVACALIVDQPTDGAEFLVILGGDRRFDVAASSTQQQSAQSILILEGPVTNLVRFGILPPDHEIARKTLLEKGVPDERIVILSAERDDWWGIADRLRLLQRRHSDAGITLLVDRFRSRTLRHILDVELDENGLPARPVCGPQPKRLRASNAEFALGAQTSIVCSLENVHVRALRDRRHDETDWWRSRSGWKAVFAGYVALTHTLVFGRPDWNDEERWDPNAYEERLRREGPKRKNTGKSRVSIQIGRTSV